MYRILWQKWIALGEWLGDAVGGIILSIFYFIIFGIPGLFLSFVYDKIGKRYDDGSYFCSDVSDLVIKEIDEAREM